MKSKKIILMTTIVLIVVINVIARKEENTAFEAVSKVVINEICSRNVSIVDEAHCVAEDYIELYNASGEEISLEGWFLSDDSGNTELQSLSGMNIPAYGYQILYAEDTLNFKIDQKGENIFLSDSKGEIADQISVPELSMDTVYARTIDGGSEWAVRKSTPGEDNAAAKEADTVTLPMPELSHESGFYPEEFVLTMQVPQGEKIYYTLDGSRPTRESSAYEDGIRICDRSSEPNVINDVRNVVADWNDYYAADEQADKANVIRAIAVDDKNNVSEVVTAVYFVGLDRYKDKNILSITADPESLIGENGIFVTGTAYDEWYLETSMSQDAVFEQGWTDNYELANFWKRGRQSEVFGNVQLLEQGKEVLNQDIGIRTQGGYNRTKAKKSMQLISRKVYSGSPYFEQKLFGEYESHAVYVSGSPDKAYFMELAEERNLGTQQSKCCEVFLNGEYWYTGVMMEKYDETYFSEHYGVREDNLLFVKDNEAVIGEEYGYLYKDMIAFLKDETIPQQEKSAYLYESCDIQSLIEWICFNLYLGNDDVSYKKNCTLWRTIEPDYSEYGDGKWRWLVYDLDHAVSDMAQENADFRSFMIINSNRFYLALCTDEEFCQQFIATAIDMMDSTFRPEHVEEVLQKWGEDLSYGEDYFLERPEYMKQSLVNEFGVKNKDIAID